MIEKVMDAIFKRFFLILVLFFSVGFAFSQSVLFWTNERVTGPIRVYWNGRYVGTITKGYSSCPGCYASGCVTVEPTKKENTWYAEAEDGSRWTSKNQSYHSTDCVAHCLVGHSSKSESYSPQNDSGNNEYLPDYSNALAGAGLALVAIAVAATEVILNSDLYVSGTISSQYGGLEFGFRNNWNRHISFEQTAVWRYALNQPIPNFLHTDNYITPSFSDNNYDYYGGEGYYYRNRSNWGCNFRLVYNFFDRDRTFRNKNFMLNPYVGFGCDYMQYDGFFTSVIGGFTLGSKRVKMDCRYTFGYDFSNQSVVVNQLQLGLIVAYQYRRFGFFRRR